VIKLDDQAFIDGFDPVIDIIPSKQVPRKLVIRSYDKDFTFLLKGTPPPPGTMGTMLMIRKRGLERRREDHAAFQADQYIAQSSTRSFFKEFTPATI
jgi:hypothetical protein